MEIRNGGGLPIKTVPLWEYGLADYDNDKLKANGNLVWFITNAKDVSNNTITYNYNNWGNEVFIYSVNYANVSIVFNYTYKENNNYSFVNGIGLANLQIAEHDHRYRKR